jgi:hypothetical protein
MNQNLRQKFRRCVQKVKAKGYAYNPWAVCMAALKKIKKKRR